MQSWDLKAIPTPDGSRSPVVLHSEQPGRAVLIGLDPGQELGDHQVKEHAWVYVVDGEAQVDSDGESVTAGPGARILLLLAPWPGEGHYREQ